MPRYVYRCNSCNDHFQVRHGMKEVQESCHLCEHPGNLTRVPQMPSIKKENKIETSSVGSLTKDFIEQNREVLSEMKKEKKETTYGD